MCGRVENIVGGSMKMQIVTPLRNVQVGQRMRKIGIQAGWTSGKVDEWVSQGNNLCPTSSILID